MELSPFPYFGPLEPHQVRGRTDLMADLTERLTVRRVTALMGPRRFGKTSVLRRVADDITRGGAAVIWFDLYEVASLADLAIRLDEGLAGASSAIADTVRQISVGLSLNLGLVRLNLTGPAKQRPDALGLVHSQLQLIQELGRQTELSLIFDEFSSIARVDGASGLLRTHLQHHYQTIGLIFAGSEPSMMTTLFAEESQPFYGQADLLQIGPLDRAEVHQLITTGFAESDRVAGALPAQIYAFGQGHPQRTMQLADIAWRHTSPGEATDQSTWATTLEAARDHVALSSERTYSSMPSGEKAVLRILASGGSIFGSAADLLDLSRGGAQHARDSLVDRGQVLRGSTRETNRSYTIVDPLFADWIRTTVPI